MVAVKANQAAAFLKKPDGRHSAFLFYGPDAGMVSERAMTLANLIASRQKPAAEIIRIDEADLDADPDRFSNELYTVSMFAEAKVIRASAGRRINAAAVKQAVTEGSSGTTLIVEAGNLKKSDALRLLFEKAGQAAAIACYGDEGSNLDMLVNETLKASGLAISPSARDMLTARLGADRILSRGEVEKLALYAAGQKEITVDDVEAIVGDASEIAIDRIINATASGDQGRAIQELSRALLSGDSAQLVILALQRHFQRLHRVRTTADAGGSVDSAIERLGPQLHFRQKDALASQGRRWTSPALARALETIATAAKSARLAGPLEDVLTERLLLTLARMARDAGR